MSNEVIALVIVFGILALVYVGIFIGLLFFEDTETPDEKADRFLRNIPW